MKTLLILLGLFLAPLLCAQTLPPEAEKVLPPPTVATIEAEQIQGWESYPSEIKALLQRALDLTKMNLKYAYGSAHPEKGGMDCSGTIFFLLTEAGVTGVPRQANQQYNWVRRANLFRAVFSTSNDSFEFNELQPGDLLFWTGTYSVERDPPITHVMIYLGKRLSDQQRMMMGASEGRYYGGIPRHGVSVFDFQLPGFPRRKGYHSSGAFIGYARIPNLPNAISP
jgi:peptidoglycan DL-endopeptidase CwlO